jgi:hypothetical protein
VRALSRQLRASSSQTGESIVQAAQSFLFPDR